MLRPYLLVTGLVSWLFCCLVDAGEPRTWTSADGKYTIVGEMVGFLDDSITIEKENKAGTVHVPLSKLSKVDREYAVLQRKSLGLKTQTDGSVTLVVPGKWLLNSQIVLGLPPGSPKWNVKSVNPAIYVAGRNASDVMNTLTVDCLPAIDSNQRRRILVNDAQDELRESLSTLGATIEQQPAHVLSLTKRYATSFVGRLANRSEVQGKLVVQFDSEACIIFRAVGSESYINGALEVIKGMSYRSDVDTEIAAAAAKRMAASGDTRFPSEKEKSLKDFIRQVKQLIRSGDTKLLIETVADEEELAEISKFTTLAEVVKEFDRQKKGAELDTILDDIDWSSAVYNELEKKVSFVAKSSGRPIVFVERKMGWRLLN